MDKPSATSRLLRQCIRAGWQPVCPVEQQGGETLWMGRYGGGADTWIAVGNPEERTAVADLTMHNDLLSDGDCVFVDAKNQARPLAQTVGGRRTRLSLECPLRRATVLRSVLGVQCDRPLECAAAVEEDLDRIVTRVTLTAAQATDARLSVPGRRGFEVTGMTLNGDPWEHRGSLRAGRNVFEATHVSLHFTFDRAALMTSRSSRTKARWRSPWSRRNRMRGRTSAS